MSTLIQVTQTSWIDPDMVSVVNLGSGADDVETFIVICMRDNGRIEVEAESGKSLKETMVRLIDRINTARAASQTA